jgi:hemoglobin-like flavoprotein
MIRRAMNPEQVETFRTSLNRCLAAPGFLDTFYKRFVASSDEVREKFKSTDLARQTRMLADSLYVLANAALSEEGSPGRGSLPYIAERHSRADLDIPSHLYDHWLACLIDTARLHDPDFAPEVEGAWRTTLGWGIEYMRSRY